MFGTLREKIGRPIIRGYSDDTIIFTDRTGNTRIMSRQNFLLVFPELEKEISLKRADA
jgi:hypothetical protein